MSIRLWIFLSHVFLVAIGFYYLTHWVTDELRPRYLEAVEEVLVDYSQTIAMLLSERVDASGSIDIGGLEQTLGKLDQLELDAQIYDMHKDHVDTRIYITDAEGIILFDSDQSREVGLDRSQSNDVYLTLQGKYGVRSTRENPDAPDSTILYIASPIMWKGEIAGVVTVCKPVTNAHFFIDQAKSKIIRAALFAALAVIILDVILAIWITRPIYRLADYAKQVSSGKRASLPVSNKSEIGTLAKAFEEMREALEGKKYVEHYVQNLTHEVKSPLTGIRSAAELLQESGMPEEDKQKFLKNILEESGRIQEIIDKLLLLASLENQKKLHHPERISLSSLIQKVADKLTPGLHHKNLQLKLDIEEKLHIQGDPFLIEHAISNLIDNAIDFSPDSGTVSIQLSKVKSRITLYVKDEGPGIPEYAQERVFERFYSLPRPDTKRKSSGLGLCLVYEVAQLHGATITLTNLPEKGLQAELVFSSH